MAYDKPIAFTMHFLSRFVTCCSSLYHYQYEDNRGRARAFTRDMSIRGCSKGRGVARGRGISPRIPTMYYTPANRVRLSPAKRDQVLNARGKKRNISAIEMDTYANTFLCL